MTRTRHSALVVLLLALPSSLLSRTVVVAQEWTYADTRHFVENTRILTLSPDLAHLTPDERGVVANLLEAGRLFEEMYQDQRHPHARWARGHLTPGSEEEILFGLFRGPIGTNGQNRRVPFLPVAPEMPGKNVYPPDITRSELDAYLATHPGQREKLLDVRHVVRRITPANLRFDLLVLHAYGGLSMLHPDLERRLEALRVGAGRSDQTFYAVPYSLAYADRLARIRELLLESSGAIEDEDPDLAAYLRLRATDLLTSDYEAGDAAWVSGQFNNLNAQIGSYETYDDALYGVKAFFSLSLLVRDRARSEALEAAMTDIQAVENSLPYDSPKRVRSRIPVGVYNVIADFGQARGTNTATILPNAPDHARKYGRTILLRYNIMTDPQLFAGAHNRFCAAVAAEHCDELTIDGNFERTLWHEIGHYLGVDRSRDGRTLDEALASYSNLYEEMKADLVSLYAARQLHESGYYSDEQLRAVYAGGILRVLQTGQPRRDQPYQTMQLMQWNWYLDRGLAELVDGRLEIHYERYHETVESLLEEVLAIQSAGDVGLAEVFVDRWTAWDADLHGVVARAAASAPGGAYWLVRYAALED